MRGVCFCGKVCYVAKGRARQAMHDLKRNVDNPDTPEHRLHVYRCPTSTHYHVGHRPYRKEAWRGAEA